MNALFRNEVPMKKRVGTHYVHNVNVGGFVSLDELKDIGAG